MNRLLRMATVLAALASATVAQAQTANGTGFGLDRFDPAERGSDFFRLDSLDIRGDARLAAGLTLDLGYKPLVVYNPDGTERSALVREQLFAHVGAAVTLVDRLRLGFNLPVAVFQAGDSATVNDIAYQAATKAALGDPRLGADLRIAGTPGDPVVFAAGARVYLPVGNRDQFAGDGKVRVQPRLMVAGQVSRFFEYAADAAFTYRALSDAVDQVPFGPELDFGIGAGLKPTPDLLIGPEFYGSTVTKSGGFFSKRTTPFEGVLGAHYQLGDFKIGLGGGPGLTRGLGSPKFRGLFSFDYAPRYVEPVHDRDQDGVPDEQDACPDQKGAPSQDARANGCPDSDGDGVADPIDACPAEKGLATSDPKTNGCPPAPIDSDGDGVTDDKDACPKDKGIKTLDPKTNGCPPDRDFDGVWDRDDACPDIPGVKTADPKTNGCPGDKDGDGIRDDQDACPDQPGIPELKGCPDKDTDGDGVPDRLDNCPNDKGPKENGGCPPKQKQLVVITKEKLEIKDKVYFDTGKASIQKKSFKLLDQIAKVIKEHPYIDAIRIEGHTDNQGSSETNRKLSQARADSVKSYLVGQGVEEKRLDARGFGPDRPIDSNKTAKGRANNRRVEFVIVTPGAEGASTESPLAPAPAAQPEKPAAPAPVHGGAKKGATPGQK